MKLAYVMSRFPLLTETFIFREMNEVERQGITISLYPLICQNRSLIHPEAETWLNRRNCTSFFSRETINANIKLFLQKPKKYISLLLSVVIGNLSSFNFLIRGLALFPKAVSMANKMKREGITHIHAHYATHPALVAWIIHQLTNINFSITIHSHDIYDCQSMLEPKLREAAFLTPISEYNIHYLVKLYGDWVRNKCHIVHCGIDHSKFMPIENKPIRKKDDLFKIIHIGSLHWKKGQSYLIQALAKLNELGVVFYCKMIGSGSEYKQLKKIIKEYNLENVVELTGSMTQTEVALLLPGADCYVQPSLSEGIPVAIMEAASCELPVVATKITGIPELVRHNNTGFLVPPADASSLANAIHSIWADPQQAFEMGLKGRILVKKEFSLKENVSKLVALFQKI